MPIYIEPNERLLSQEHWGADINDPAQFEPDREVDLEYLAPFEQHKASIALADCLDEAMQNGMEGTKADTESFNPSSAEMPDGSVIILDNESLSAYTLDSRRMSNWDPKEVAENSGMDKGLVDMWRRNQPAPDEADFGTERAVFIDEKMIYSRSLRWGVLMTRQNGSGQRVAATWRFAAPHTTGGGVIVPVDTQTPDGWGREAMPLPIELGQTVTRPAIRSFHFAIRTIARTNAVYVVKVAEDK